MTRRRTLAAALLALFVAGSSAPALAADAPASYDPSTERVCVFLGSNPADRQYFCAYFPWPL